MLWRRAAAESADPARSSRRRRLGGRQKGGFRLESHNPGRSGETKIGVRPEHARLSDSGSLKARAAYSEALGAETLVHLKCADGTQVTVRQDVASATPQEGTKVGLDWDPANEMRFDSSGQRC